MKKRVNPIFLIVFGILDIAAVAGLVFFIIMSMGKQTVSNEDTEEDIAAMSTQASVQEVDTTLTQNVDISVVSTRNAESTVETENSLEDVVQDSEYIFADSDSRFLEEEELESLTQEEMRIARNEIYARHGRKFADEALQKYFDEKSWYEPSLEPEEFDSLGDEIFNEYEFYNKNLIGNMEKELGYL